MKKIHSTKEELFVFVCETNKVHYFFNDELILAEELVKEGLLLCCDSIAGTEKAVNRSYAYVTNDRAGIKLALECKY